MSNITTKSLSPNFAETGESVLKETAQTELVFKAQIHGGGVRGTIIRYKKDKSGKRKDPVPVDFRKLHPHEGVEIELDTEALSKLLQCINERRAILEARGIELGRHKYKVANAEDLVITDQNKGVVIRKLLQANYGEEIWEQLTHNNPDIATRLAYARMCQNRKDALDAFKKSLEDESQSEEDWQKFFEKNTWIFGYGLRYQFLKIIQAQPNYGGASIDRNGSQRGDFLAATEAGIKFSCLVEIKKPSTALLRKTQYRNGAWSISEELAGAISQVQVNCAQWENVDSRSDQNRERLPDVYTIYPKGIVVIGCTKELDDFDKRNSFERFRRNLQNPEIITYDELLERARFIVSTQ